MTLRATDLIAIVALMAAGFAAIYMLLLRKLRTSGTERQLKIVDQLGALDNAIRSLETRLTEHRLQPLGTESPRLADIESQRTSEDATEDKEESGEIAPEIQAAIAAATVAALGPNAAVRSVKPMTSPWSQQGRVLVQGSHNLRVRR